MLKNSVKRWKNSKDNIFYNSLTMILKELDDIQRRETLNPMDSSL